MRAVVQRVKEAAVVINNEKYSSITQGYLILLGISATDNKKDLNYMLDKILNLRIFPDDNDKVNLSLLDNQYELLVVSQFTLYGDARKGRRPSFIRSAPPEKANQLYENFIELLKQEYHNDKVKTGVFQEKMDVTLVNDGPFTILLDSDKEF
ncbi:MAG: D-aminoacyl-tRNA deacylase [Spirochaetes bacterium]|nr:D-aminoacyl-tRNA deacylase [Spirochaetota bacterium]